MTTQVKKQLYISKEQEEFIQRYAKETGVPRSEIFRRAIDMFIERVSDNQPVIQHNFKLKKSLPGNGGGLVIIPPELWNEYVEEVIIDE